ncbi:MAG TPA: MlaD family protein [Flavisolibacter sp.]|jgi:phospholipid/cholesterol/gamma-HCH transport system substrate-binding protein|nr:MlaD family protein [Flavisolibacter sp.]
MKMDNNKRMVTVGVFVLIGIIIFVAAVLTLGGQKKTFEAKSTLRAIFKDVNGLQAGNNVWFSGVKVGTVKKISFMPNSMVEVIMNIQTSDMAYIKKDAKAKISSEGLIGNKIIVIFDGSAQSASVAENDLLTTDSGMGTDEMMATLQQNNKNLLDITGNIKVITERLMKGQGSAGKILSDDKLANDLQAAISGLRTASMQVQSITSDVASYTSQLQSEGSLTNSLVHDTVFYSHLKASAAQIQQASATIKESSDNIKRITGNIENVSRRLDSTGSPVGVLLNDEEAGKNLKMTLENLQGGSKKLDEDLEALQHNFLFRGFFKKKAKAEKKD